MKPSSSFTITSNGGAYSAALTGTGTGTLSAPDSTTYYSKVTYKIGYTQTVAGGPIPVGATWTVELGVGSATLNDFGYTAGKHGEPQAANPYGRAARDRTRSA